MTTRLLFASNNRGKLREVGARLARIGLEVIGPADLGIVFDVEETGETFGANARLKAEAWSLRAGLPALADDSGLEVDALDGRPGVRSARYGGEGLDDAGRNALLLKELDSVPVDKRGACFRCALALALGGRVVLEVDGSRRGVILQELRGAEGFGYDPVFWVPELQASFAELSPERKQSESHRARALEALAAELNRAGGLAGLAGTL